MRSYVVAYFILDADNALVVYIIDMIISDISRVSISLNCWSEKLFGLPFHSFGGLDVIFR